MKKHIKQIFMCIAIILIVSGTILSRPIADLDEIWNYNTARVISEGKIPYKDVSMITTPLLPSINAICLKIFSNNLLTMRILAIILISSILLMVYFILNKLKVQKCISILSTMFIGYLLQNYFCIDYNFFVLFLTLIIIYLEIRNLDNTTQSNTQNKKQQLKHNLLIGILAGLCIITKQTTGMLISIAVLSYEIIILLYNNYRDKQQTRYHKK